jgi:hypothetical protein
MPDPGDEVITYEVPNVSMASMGGTPGESKLESYLKQNGPTPRSNVPVHKKTVSRDLAAREFSPRRGPIGATEAVPVVYLPSHDPDAIIETWTEANADWLSELSQSTITRRIAENYDDDWVNAWRRCAPEFGIQSHQQAPEDAGKDPFRKCPKCGDQVRARKFTRHLQECQ